MSERVDILMPVRDSLPYFTVNTGAAYVQVQYPGAILHDFIASARCVAPAYTAGKIFQQGDNYIIMSCGLILPLSFQIERTENAGVTDPHIVFNMSMVGYTTGKVYFIREINYAGGGFYAVMENYDTPLDIFVNILIQNAVTGSYIKDEPFFLTLNITTTNLYVSMAGVPATLNGTKQYIIPYVKVLHTLSLP